MNPDFLKRLRHYTRELGLFLCECIYHAYNTRYEKSHQPIGLAPYADKVEAFKRKFIYSHISRTEQEEHTMQDWLRSLNPR